MQRMNALEVFMRARALISDPNKWGKHSYERDGRYCLRGAVHYAETGVADWCGEDNDTIRALRKVVPNRTPAFFNDDPSTSHADVLAALDRAIEAEWQKCQGQSCEVLSEAVIA